MTETNRNAVGPELMRVVEMIGSKSIFQKKALRRFLDTCDDTYFEFAESLVVRLKQIVEHQGSQFEFLATAYSDYTKEIKAEEIYFAKEHAYRRKNFAEAYDAIYSQEDYMFHYVIGLAMTLIFWPNHYRIVRFYLDHFLPRIENFKTGAEAGVGHGFFHAEMLKSAPAMQSTMLDISPVSLNATHRMIAATGLDPARATATLCDVQKEIPIEERSLDALLLGEIIEHLEDGAGIMRAFVKKMTPDGLCFLTTAANAPAPDHILLFNTVDEIRTLLEDSGWSIEDEYIGTMPGMTVAEAEEKKQNINYAAVLSVRK